MVVRRETNPALKLTSPETGSTLVCLVWSWMPLLEEGGEKMLEVCHAKEILLYPNPELCPFTGRQANSCCRFSNKQYHGKRCFYTCAFPYIQPQTLKVSLIQNMKTTFQAQHINVFKRLCTNLGTSLNFHIHNFCYQHFTGFLTSSCFLLNI